MSTTDEQKSPDYLKLNPNARVPTLIEDGRVMYEFAAILLYLCEKHPQAGLMPAVGSPQRARFLQWLFYLTNTAQEALMNWWHADNYLDKSEEQTALMAGAERRLAKMWQLLDSGRDLRPLSAGTRLHRRRSVPHHGRPLVAQDRASPPAALPTSAS